MVRRRHPFVVGFVALLAVVAIAAGASAVAADTPAVQQSVNSQANQTEEADACEGAPQMSQTSITSPEGSITSEEPAVIEANFRTDPTLPDDCTVMVDLEFSFSQSGFQWGGGAEWEQATSNLVATQFEVDAGEIRDIRGELHTNGAEPGDEVTVIADYEIWYEGDRDNSRQQSGIRHTIEVEEPNPAETASEIESDDKPESDDESAVPPIIAENLGLLAMFVLAVIAVVGLIKREPFVQVFTGNR